jgi:hypothetical protein
MTVIWDIPPKHPWELPVVISHFLSGISSGVILILVYHLLLKIKELEVLVFPAINIAIILSIASSLTLVMDLEQPFRAYMLFIYPNLTSPLAWGAFLSVIYPAVLLLFLLFFHTKKVWAVIVCILAGLMGMYPGTAIYGVMAKRHGCADIMCVYSIASAIVSGIAVISIYAICRKLRQTFSILRSSLCNVLPILIFVLCVIMFLCNHTPIFLQNFTLICIAFCTFIISFIILLLPFTRNSILCLMACTGAVLLALVIIKFLIYTHF